MLLKCSLPSLLAFVWSAYHEPKTSTVGGLVRAAEKLLWKGMVLPVASLGHRVLIS